MSTLILDASVAMKWFVDEEWSDAAEALRIGVHNSGGTFTCPPHFRGEVTNALYQLLRRGLLSSEEAVAAITRFAAIEFIVFSDPNLYESAFALARRYQLATIYDALYLAVAQELQVPLWTDDRRLLNALGSYSAGA